MIVALKPGVTQESREQLMDWLQNLGLHIHVSEGMNDVYDSLQNYGRRPVQRLHASVNHRTI